MLPRAHRLVRRRDFDTVYRTGRTARGRLLTVRSRVRSDGATHFGFVVSTRVSKRATIRNRIKRQLRHISQGLLPTMPKGLDIILTYHGGATVDAATLRQATQNALATLQ